MPALRPRRGEIWWTELDPTRGSEIQKTRPCVIVTSDVLNARRRTVVVVPLATSPTS
jgi:mRNA interferase MazF